MWRVLPIVGLLGLAPIGFCQDPIDYLADVELVEEFEIGGRKALRYTHVKRGGSEVPFFVVPADGLIASPPLRVILHHAGGSAPKAIKEAFAAKHRHQYVDQEHCALYLDCRSVKEDWWWGWKAIEKDKDGYKGKLQAAEERVLQTVEWVIKEQGIDRNRVYLSGRSMGGTGSLGIGYVRGDVFAAMLVNVPAGAEHFLYRLENSDYPDPPPTVNTSSQTDGWSKRQEDLLGYCQEHKLPMIFAWGPFGHASRPDMANSAVYDFPWLEIVRNEAYPVFTHADSDDTYPGHKGTGEDQEGQINGYFRWKNVTDTEGAFVIELRLVKNTELGKPADIPEQATADVTLRRLQAFKVEKGKTYKWKFVRGGKVLQGGSVQPDEQCALTIENVTVASAPGQLQILE